jgi:hypothetical protein
MVKLVGSRGGVGEVVAVYAAGLYRVGCLGLGRRLEGRDLGAGGGWFAFSGRLLVEAGGGWCVVSGKLLGVGEPGGDGVVGGDGGDGVGCGVSDGKSGGGLGKIET